MAAADNSAAPSNAQLAARFFVAGLLLALLLIATWPTIRTGDRSDSDEDATAERIKPIAEVDLRPPVALTPKGQKTGLVLVQETCQSCHRQGEDGAPKIGDRKAWAARQGKGLKALVQSVASGNGCTLAQSGFAADDMELARAIVYMIWPRMRL